MKKRILEPVSTQSPTDWLVRGGEMVKAIRSMNWSGSPLGPLETWPQSLRTTVNLAQASSSPICVIWGEGSVQIYNDGYWPICGAKHPLAMGQDFRECWASAWPVIGEAFLTAWSGKSAYLEKMRMFLDRYGFLEETWFTFSFSPVTDESGAVGGLFHPVLEMTGQMLAERRTKTLRDLASRAGRARTSQEAVGISAEVLAESDLDIPFALFYGLDAQLCQATLLGQFALEPGSPGCPESVDLLTVPSPFWPILEAARGGVPMRYDDVAEVVENQPVGPYPEAPKIAFVLPITLPGNERPVAVMIAGVSARLGLDEAYSSHYELVAAMVSAALANARAYEVERQRAEAMAALAEAKTEFFSNVSHEFRTPLTLILGPLEDELAERENALPAARRQRLETAHRNSLRLLKLVNTLLSFSRAEAGHAQATFEPVDLATTTAELASVFRSATEKAGLSLTVDCPPLPEPIYVDPEMWEKVVLNLLSNALKHTFSGGIRVGLQWCADHVELTVADTGVGIPAEEIPRLFDRFHRVKNVRSRSHEGTGIGLALVQELVRLHGGTVCVESQSGRGSVFRVTLPSSRAHLPEGQIRGPGSTIAATLKAAPYVEEASQWIPEGVPELLSTPVPGGEQGARGGSRARVLWVDDNADMREYVRRLLTSTYEVLTASDGREALLTARREIPDLVLTDVMMPELDGYGLLRELRQDPDTCRIPVILLSARAGEEAVLEGLDTGADDYLVKPFSARELLARVRTHLAQARQRREWSDKLERVNRELEEFAYIASHDLQEPLRMVRSYVQLLEKEYKGKLDPVADKYIFYAVDGATRMQGLISDLLMVSNLHAKPVAVVPTDLHGVVETVLADLQIAIAESKAVVSVDTLPVVLADSGQLRLVFQNLVANALKFRKLDEVPRVRISAEAHGSDWILSVQDNGLGIANKHAERIFRMFQRLHNRTEYPGTGIGLAICKKIIERSGGRIWCESEVGHGANFRFQLVGIGRLS